MVGELMTVVQTTTVLFFVLLRRRTGSMPLIAQRWWLLPRTLFWLCGP